MNKYIESVSHLKKKLEKGVSYEKTMHILHKLQKIPISIDLLQATGIGKTVRNLSKLHDNDIKKTARLLCLTWKAIVKEQQEQELEQDHNHDCDQTFNNIKKKPQFDDFIDEPINKDYAESNHKIKNEHNSNNREAKASNRESKSSEHKKAKKVESDDEHKNCDSDYDNKHSKSSHKKHKSSHKSKNSESKNPKTEFEAFLGLNDEITKNNKKNSSNKKSETDKSDTKVRHSSNKTNEKLSEKSKKYDEKHKTKADSNGRNHSSHSFPPAPPLLAFPPALDSNIKLKSLEKMDILSSLPTPNYKPLPNRELIDERVEANRRKTLRSSEDLSLRVQSKKGRTAVFAGHARSNVYTHVHPLEDLCIRVLMDNIDKLYYFGDAPYYLLKQVLQKCNPKQLSRLEKFNPQIMDETDELWEEFCKKEFRGREPDEDEDECWRELYYRCVKERDDKLKNITKHITHKQAKALPGFT
jgi:transcription elongation factor B polypeptide 3